MNKSFLKSIGYGVLIIIIAFVVIWLASLLKCEILTWIYHDDFEFAYTDNTMLGDMKYLKVLKCNDETAEVYYVGKDMTHGSVLTFEKQDENWVETRWDTIWSTGGNAADVIFPYWWHCIYGGL